jgi:endonuclease/exonuclease/phosphatase family metal-dependent hydrolase
MSSSAESISVVTQNMSINNGDVIQRFWVFEELMLLKLPDIIAVQEVSRDVGLASILRIAGSLHSATGHVYGTRYTAVYPGQENEQGVAVISRLPILASCTSNFRDGGNQVQITQLDTSHGALALGNVHLEAAPQKEGQRRRKMGELALYMAGLQPAAQIVAGDFNTPQWPVFRTTRDLEQKHGYTSAFKEVHGHEPSYTFPALSPEELEAGGYLKPGELLQLKVLASVIRPFKRDTPALPHYATDYMFYKGELEPIAAEVVGDGERGTPSDHLGLWVKLLWGTLQPSM